MNIDKLAVFIDKINSQNTDISQWSNRLSIVQRLELIYLLSITKVSEYINRKNKTSTLLEYGRKSYDYYWMNSDTSKTISSLLENDFFNNNDQLNDFYKSLMASNGIKELKYIHSYKVALAVFNSPYSKTHISSNRSRKNTHNHDETNSNIASSFITNSVSILRRKIIYGFKHEINGNEKQLIFSLILLAELIKDYEQLINEVLPYFNTYAKLLAWLNRMIEDFNFNNYAYYYFLLDSDERKEFNWRAKQRMGNELKQSMLKQKTPWEFIKKTGNGDEVLFKATWRSIWFEDGKIRICTDKTPSFTQPFTWEFSEEKFNLLENYISGKRLKHLNVYYLNGKVVKITGIEELEEIIWKIQIIREVESGKNTNSRTTLSHSRIPINMILRNECIQHLNRLQIEKLEPTRLLEKAFNIIKGRMNIDVSLLYSIPIDKNEIAIIWESLEIDKAKATHIFKCKVDEYGLVFNNIKVYLSSKDKVRSSLNSKDIEYMKMQEKINYLGRIDHDNFEFDVWRNRLNNTLPALRHK